MWGLQIKQFLYTVPGRGVASRKQVRGLQHNNIIANYCKCEPRHRNYTKIGQKWGGPWSPLGPIVATPVVPGMKIIYITVMWYRSLVLYKSYVKIIIIILMHTECCQTLLSIKKNLFKIL